MVGGNVGQHLMAGCKQCVAVMDSKMEDSCLLPILDLIRIPKTSHATTAIQRPKVSELASIQPKQLKYDVVSVLIQ